MDIFDAQSPSGYSPPGPESVKLPTNLPDMTKIPVITSLENVPTKIGGDFNPVELTSLGSLPEKLEITSVQTKIKAHRGEDKISLNPVNNKPSI